jgi:hypothetical protein
MVELARNCDNIGCMKNMCQADRDNEKIVELLEKILTRLGDIESELKNLSDESEESNGSKRISDIDKARLGPDPWPL